MKRHLWTAFKALAWLLSLLPAYHLYYLEKPSKAIQVVLEQSGRVFGISDSVSSELYGIYNGDTVKNVDLIMVKLLNSGKQQIDSMDIKKQLWFSFGSQNEILEATIIESDPEELGIKISKKSPDKVTVTSTLLNSGDYVRIRFLVSVFGAGKASEDFSCGGRIAGVKEIKVAVGNDKGSEPSKRGFGLISLISAALGVAASFAVNRARDWNSRRRVKEMPETNHLETAIKKKVAIQFRYLREGKTSEVRIGNPHAIFIKRLKDGSENTYVHIWQTGGATDSDQPLPSWRQYFLEGIKNVELISPAQPFETRADYNASFYEFPICII